MAKLDSTRFNDWLDTYGEAWIAGDPDAVVELFTPDARYHETPFTEPLIGREAIHGYWAAGPRDAQEHVRFSHDIVAVVGGVGVARWRANFARVGSGRRIELDGVLLAEFARDGRCTVFREWWHRREGA
jgi:hypothetical protein